MADLHVTMEFTLRLTKEEFRTVNAALQRVAKQATNPEATDPERAFGERCALLQDALFRQRNALMDAGLREIGKHISNEGKVPDAAG